MFWVVLWNQYSGLVVPVFEFSVVRMTGQPSTMKRPLGGQTLSVCLSVCLSMIYNVFPVDNLMTKASSNMLLGMLLCREKILKIERPRWRISLYDLSHRIQLLTMD